MPTVFLSYASQDDAYAKSLEQELTKHEITVWRDQQSLQAGQDWPKALGEAIADHDSFLLLWSIHAQESTFVNKEWNSAFAQNKPIIPVQLDTTPLPHSLQSVHSLEGQDLQQVALKIVAAVNQQPALSSNSANISKKTWHLEPWHKRVATLSAVVGIIVGGLKIQKVIQDPITQTISVTTSTNQTNDKSSSQPEDENFEQTLEGSIRDEEGNPIPGVQVSLTNIDMAVTTNQYGRFEFQIKAPSDTWVELVAQKEGYKTYKADFQLGPIPQRFIMKKRMS